MEHRPVDEYVGCDTQGKGVHPSAVASMPEEPPPPGEVLHPDTLQPISASDAALQEDGDLDEPPTLQRFTASGLGKAVFKALSNIEPLEQDGYLAKKTASTTAKTLKTAASLKSSTDVLEVVQKTQVEVQEEVEKTQKKLLTAVTKTQERVSDGWQTTRAQTKESTTALVDYSKRVWKISNWWRSPPQAVARGSKPKLLIVYSDTGGGHKASANAICAAFERLVPGQIEVKPVDVIEQYSLWPSNRTYSFFTSYPWLWGMIYKTTKQTHNLNKPEAAHTSTSSKTSPDAGGAAATLRTREQTRISTQLAHASERYTDTPSSTLASHLFDPAVSLEPFILEGFIRCIQEERPDMIMSVHPILQSAPRATSSHLKNGRKIPFVTVVTDLGEAHPWWFNKKLDALFVPTRAMKEQGIQLGLKADNIHVCGLPLMFWDVDASDARKIALREQLGLEQARPVMLVMGGGDGMGKLKETSLSFVKLLASSPSLPPEEALQVVIVCGKNEALKGVLEKEVARAQASCGRELSVRLLGFVTNVDEWMVAADILVTKAGPGTIAEACCCQTPILLFDYLPGQEEGNVTFVCERGMGEEEKVAGNVAQRCLEWVRDPAKLARFRQAAREQAQPTSAIDIARMTLEILQEEARLNEHEASTADEPAAAGGGGGEGAQGGQGKSRLGRSHSEGDIAQCGDADRTSDVKYQYVYRTAWWSWLSPFNHERAPSWWRESRVPIPDGKDAHTEKQSPAAGLGSSAIGLFPVLPLQVPAEVPAEEAQPPAVDGASPERSMSK